MKRDARKYGEIINCPRTAGAYELFPYKMSEYLGAGPENGYMDMAKWKTCQVDKLPVDTKGMSVYVGI